MSTLLQCNHRGNPRIQKQDLVFPMWDTTPSPEGFVYWSCGVNQMHNSSLGGKVSVCRLRTAPNEQQFTRNGRWLSFTWHFVFGINQRVMKKLSSKEINTIISTISVQNNISWHNTNSSTDVVMFRYVTFKCHLKCWDKGTNNSNLTNILL